MEQSAVVLTNDSFREIRAKTAHGMVRGPSRFRVQAIVDRTAAGEDAGELLDGVRREIPIVASLDDALQLGRPDFVVLGVATPGGGLPQPLRAVLIEAARSGLALVNGLHQLLADDADIAGAAAESGAELLDLRRPKPVSELRFWTGEIADVETPIVAVLGTDCAIGKRTTCMLLHGALHRRGLHAEAIYTGQSGWLQGIRFGFLLDATPNDFVSGELEGAVLACVRETDPAIVLLEGQSALRNPSGPCGAEFLLSAGARGVVLQHAPAREAFHSHGWPFRPLAEELELVRLYGSEVWAVTLNEAGLSDERAEEARQRLEGELGVPVLRPLMDGGDELAAVVAARARLSS